MKKLKSIAVISMLFAGSVGTVLAGQDWYHDRDTFYRGNNWHNQVFGQVAEDLNHIYSAGAAAQKEQNRIEHTRQELIGLQAKFDQGVWDNGIVNDVIDSLRKSANDQRLGPRDREVLADDAAKVHEFQHNYKQYMHH
jgi:hypothetical protein